MSPCPTRSRMKARSLFASLPKLRSVCLLLATFGLVGCDEVTEWRQKVTVEVETPQGLRTGSAVQWAEIRMGEGPTEYYGWGVSWDTDGEAVVIDVRPDAPEGEPRYLFALLIGNKVNQFRGGSWGALGPNGLEALMGTDRFIGKVPNDGSFYDEMSKVMDDLPLGATGEAKGKALPAMVTFADVDDPRTVKVLDPLALDEAFGPGVRLKRVTITKTDEPVTVGKVEAVLDWIMRGYVIPAEEQPAYVKDQTPEQLLSSRHFVALQRFGKNR